jgi:hypothetical protein
MQKIAISLGWNCNSAIYGVENSIRKTKKEGYLTCPFDEMVTNYKGIIECIKDDFEFLCDICIYINTYIYIWVKKVYL